MDTIQGRTEKILVIEAPPRHGKSELISRYLPAWFLGRWPEKKVVLATYGAAFSSGWGRKAKYTMQEFGHLFGVRINPDKESAADWETTEGGGMVSVGVGGPLMGRGADLMIVDDPLKSAEEAISETTRQAQWDWWQSTASTRLEPEGIVIVIMQRWHRNDLAGRLIDEAAHDGMPVRRLTLRAIAEHDDPLGRQPGEPLWPVRYDAAALDEIHRSKDDYWWLAQYQQRPTRHENAQWPDSYFSPDIWCDSFTWPDAFEVAAQVTDPSMGKNTKAGDFAATTFAGLCGGKIWIDSRIRRESPESIVRGAIQMYNRLHPDVTGIESNAFQALFSPIFHQQCRDWGIPPISMQHIDNRVNKNLRISNIGPYLRDDKLRFLDTADNRLLVRQLQEFPIADHDDGPDALEMALRLLRQAATGSNVQPTQVMT